METEPRRGRGKMGMDSGFLLGRKGIFKEEKQKEEKHLDAEQPLLEAATEESDGAPPGMRFIPHVPSAFTRTTGFAMEVEFDEDVTPEQAQRLMYKHTPKTIKRLQDAGFTEEPMLKLPLSEQAP